MENSFNPEQIERELYARWEASGSFAPTGNGNPYCILIPPPNVTGTLHGSITIDGINPNRLMKVIDKLRATGAEIDYNEDSISINMKLEFPNPVDITTAPFPEFPTDMQAQFSVINAISTGTANIYETVFENRFMHILELNRMGCDISVKGNHAVIQGVKSIYGAQVMATDLRASASLILAGLCAEGDTVVDRIYHIDRGYERIEEKLNYLGANIIRLPS